MFLNFIYLHHIWVVWTTIFQCSAVLHQKHLGEIGHAKNTDVSCGQLWPKYVCYSEDLKKLKRSLDNCMYQISIRQNKIANFVLKCTDTETVL